MQREKQRWIAQEIEWGRAASQLLPAGVSTEFGRTPHLKRLLFLRQGLSIFVKRILLFTIRSQKKKDNWLYILASSRGRRTNTYDRDTSILYPVPEHLPLCTCICRSLLPACERIGGSNKEKRSSDLSHKNPHLHMECPLLANVPLKERLDLNVLYTWPTERPLQMTRDAIRNAACAA